MVSPPDTIGLRLLATRQELALTRNGAAMVLGYVFDVYAKTEDGRRLPRPIEIPALAQWLGCPADELNKMLACEYEAKRAAKSHATNSIAAGAP